MNTAPTLAALIEKATTLASFPAVFAQINEAIERPGSSAADIARVIETDQGLAARLLRIANSAFYSFPGRVDSIGQAVIIIGTRQLRDLAIGTIAMSQFTGIDPALIGMASFWRHGLACGLAARALARRRREPNTERFFIAGLLHDVGSMLLFQQLPAVAAEILTRHQRDGELLEMVEQEILHYDHARIGQELLAAWKLPVVLQRVAGEHHRFSGFSLQSPHAMEVATVHLADVLVCGLEIGSSGERVVPCLYPAAWDLLGLPTTVLGETANEVERTIGNMESVFLTHDRVS